MRPLLDYLCWQDDAELDKTKLEGIARELSKREKDLRQQEELFVARVSASTNTTFATLTSQLDGLKDFGYVLQVDVLGNVMGEEVGEDVSLALTLSTLRLTAEHALIIPLTPVNHDVILEDA